VRGERLASTILGTPWKSLLELAATRVTRTHHGKPLGHRGDLPRRRVAARVLPVCQGLATPSQPDVMRYLPGAIRTVRTAVGLRCPMPLL
jgi:hypothetical protein